MANLSFEELVAAVHKLPPEQKAALVQTLQAPANISPTREQLVAELQVLRATSHASLSTFTAHCLTGEDTPPHLPPR